MGGAQVGVTGGVLALIAVKFALMYAIARVSGTANDTAQRLAFALFKDHDEAQLEAQYAVHDDQEQLIQTTRQAADQLQALLEADISRPLAVLPERAKGDRRPSA